MVLCLTYDANVADYSIASASPQPYVVVASKQIQEWIGNTDSGVIVEAMEELLAVKEQSGLERTLSTDTDQQSADKSLIPKSGPIRYGTIAAVAVAVAMHWLIILFYSVRRTRK